MRFENFSELKIVAFLTSTTSYQCLSEICCLCFYPKHESNAYKTIRCHDPEDQSLNHLTVGMKVSKSRPVHQQQLSSQMQPQHKTTFSSFLHVCFSSSPPTASADYCFLIFPSSTNSLNPDIHCLAFF
jgi:hypothetical protein